MPWLVRIALIAVGFGLAKFTETEVCKDMTEVLKTGSRQIKKDLEKEVDDLKTKVKEK
jgi:hypothetical protein